MSDRTTRNWKNFCSLVVYEFGKRFNIEKEDDIQIVKTTIGDGMGVGIKIDSKFVESDIHTINSIINKLTRRLEKKGIKTLWGWGILCDDDYVDTTITESLDDKPLVLVLGINGNLSSSKVPIISEDEIKFLGSIYSNCLNRLYNDVEDVFNKDSNVDLGDMSDSKYYDSTDIEDNSLRYNGDKRLSYRVDVTNGVCSKIPSESINPLKYNVPMDVILKLNTKDYTVLVDDNLTCYLRTKSISNKKPFWFNKLLALSKKNIKFSEDEDITIQVSIKDTGNSNISVYCFIHPNIDCIKIFSGCGNDFFHNNMVSPEWKWLPSYIYDMCIFYDWLNIVCIDLFLTVDPRNYNPDKCKLLRGITTEKGLFGGIDNEYCEDGAYAISEIICLKN